jgi:hypothetical protein
MLKYTTFFYLTERFAHRLRFVQLATAVAVLQPPSLERTRILVMFAAAIGSYLEPPKRGF